MNDTNIPTDQELFDVAGRICDFASDEMERRGYGWAFSLVSLMLAGDAAIRFIKLVDVFGLDGVSELSEAIKEKMIGDMLGQAEDILRGDAE
jgi:hypothetical protein